MCNFVPSIRYTVSASSSVRPQMIVCSEYSVPNKRNVEDSKLSVAFHAGSIMNYGFRKFRVNSKFVRALS